MRSRYTPEDENEEVASDGAYYAGDPNTNGSWRMIRVGNNWESQRRESGSWVKKGAFTTSA